MGREAYAPKTVQAIVARRMQRRLADATAADRAPFVDRRFAERVLSMQPTTRGDPSAPVRPGSSLSLERAMQIFSAQIDSRHLDLCARSLKQRGAGYHTVGSSGHEGNAAVAAALAPTDPALLHYRSGAFFLERARQAGLSSAVLDVLLGMVASSDDPIAGGRHKVIGSAALSIPPQTSTIASHLPKAVGMAFAHERKKRIGIPLELPIDAIIVCSFGDASVNHSTACGAFNAAAWASYREAPVPILFVCEDNGFGISVPTPSGWVAANFRERQGIAYFQADGLDLSQTYDATLAAASYVRETRRPAFLHVHMVRLMGHAGSDVETMYRAVEEIEADEERDPLIASAELLVDVGAATPAELVAMYEEARTRIGALADEALKHPKLASAAEVMAPLAPRDDAVIAAEVARPWNAEARRRFWGNKLPEEQRPAPLGGTINRALGDLLVRYPEMLLFGEDVAQKGGVYGVTRDLQRRARPGRVFDTLLDEQTILGLAIGAGHMGLLPVPEIQYLAYLHNAEDQLRGEAATLSFFSQRQYQNPMVVRIASYAYQKGFGGHFHNDNSVAVLRDIPGVIIASPAHGDDAVPMLQTCMAAARTAGSVCVYLEPIALYPVRDLHDPGDGKWCSTYNGEPAHVPIGKARVWHEDARDLLIVTWANGLWMSLRVAQRLERDHGIRARVLDLRWLAPLPREDVIAHARDIGRVLCVDETRASGGVSEAIFTLLVESSFTGQMRRLTACDSFVPLGEAANLVLVQERDIERAALELVRPG
jgi:2-oxoisovalerate dehydrogenase E1 component